MNSLTLYIALLSCFGKIVLDVITGKVESGSGKKGCFPSILEISNN